MLTPEGKLKKQVRAYLKAIGAYRFSPVQMGLGQTTLDELCCIRGRFVGIELKAPGKIPTPRQRLTMSDIKRAGGVAIWADSYEMFIEALDRAIGTP